MKDDRLYLIYILECLDRIDRYTSSGRDAFFSDTMVQDAVLRNLHTLSESTQRLSDELKGKHPKVDWYGIAGFRNVLVHDYLGIDLKTVWDIVQRDLPQLKVTVTRMLSGHGQ
ncbi:MAG TPA: DUF86 domain-containing protein [Anaerolineae bacterium]|nr:DUF86 domain-containing protein [Anaerolineae bacterium]